MGGGDGGDGCGYRPEVCGSQSPSHTAAYPRREVPPSEAKNRNKRLFLELRGIVMYIL